MGRTKIYSQEITSLLARWPSKDIGRDHRLDNNQTTPISRGYFPPEGAYRDVRPVGTKGEKFTLLRQSRKSFMAD